MGKFVPARNLDATIAVRFGKPRVERVLRMLTDEAKSRAPGVRAWITARDERVRHSHMEADGQLVPDNLRFKVPSVNGIGTDLARHPRDPNLPIANRANCRCDDPTIGPLLADSIHATDCSVVGNRVSGSVETRFPRAAESENGTDQDAAAHYMQGALTEIAARLKAGHQ